MGSNGLHVWAGSKRLQSVAKNFHPYKPPTRTVLTRRAAVLVCLYRGDAGELRIILTKRSSTLSSHSEMLNLKLPSQVQKKQQPVAGVDESSSRDDIPPRK